MSLLRNCKHTDQEFIEAVANSTSIRETLIKLDLKPQGANYRGFYKKCKTLNVDTSHFLGQANNKGKRFPPKRNIEDYLSNKQTINSNALRKRLLKENIFQHKCYNCNNEVWMNNPIPLELEHKDGNHLNNSLDNLTLLCPNCHALTDTYRGKKLKKSKPKSYHAKKIYKCSDCDKKISRNADRCKSCAGKHSMKPVCKRPSKEQLLKDKSDLKYFTRIGEKYEVSDNAVRKWFKFYQIPI